MCEWAIVRVHVRAHSMISAPATWQPRGLWQHSCFAGVTRPAARTTPRAHRAVASDSAPPFSRRSV